ncbi:hypothetical protein [uncultured Aquitalea sp.]|uniref:hypothetical protein n=1 Tax=uncultured Aquitalea sp. TaxID=540272 RepID=UPI0025F2B867|nr:hypothetical protein [uncultured Aquitalea sp.]
MAKEDQGAEVVSDELKNPELDALVAQHEPVAQEYQPGEAPAPASMGNAQCVAMGLEMAVSMGKHYFPSLENTAPPEKCQAVAESVGAVLDKYGVAAGGWLSQYGAELAALVTCSTFGFGVYAGIKADIAARAAEKPKKEPAPAADMQEAPKQESDLPGWSAVNVG